MSEGLTGTGAEGAGVRLCQLKDALMARWSLRARNEVAAAREQDELSLRDTLPEVIDVLAEALCDPDPHGVLRQREATLGEAHGKQRAQHGEYSLEQVVDEYHHFRQVLFEGLEVDAPLRERDRDVLLRGIDLSIRNAVREFARDRTSEQKQAAKALADANEQLDAKVRERTAELTRSELRFTHLVESVADYAIFTLDPHGVITTWNPGAHRMKGYSAEEIIGTHYSILYPEDGKRRNEPMGHLETAAKVGRFRGEGLRVRKNGDFFVADVCITPMYEDGELSGFSKVVQDLTERNMLLQERDLSRTDVDRLRIEAEYRERFVATLTHDLRSPLSAAATAAALIHRSPDQQDKVRIWATRISDAVQRTDKMISDLLDASRLQAGEPLPLEFGQCDLKFLAQETCDEMATRYGARFKLRSENDTTAVCSADGMRRVIDNLLSNAIKYSPPSTEILVLVKGIDDRVHLLVHNHGTIIPVEEQAKLFKPFHRTPSATTSGTKGWGLGLTLVKGIVDAHGGMVKVESYPKEGTTFTVDIPKDVRTHGRELSDTAK